MMISSKYYNTSTKQSLKKGELVVLNKSLLLNELYLMDKGIRDCFQTLVSGDDESISKDIDTVDRINKLWEPVSEVLRNILIMDIIYSK